MPEVLFPPNALLMARMDYEEELRKTTFVTWLSTLNFYLEIWGQVSVNDSAYVFLLLEDIDLHTECACIYRFHTHMFIFPQGHQTEVIIPGKSNLYYKHLFGRNSASFCTLTVVRICIYTCSELYKQPKTKKS